MYISGATGFYLLSFLESMQDMHGWVHSRQSIVSIGVSGLLTHTPKGPGSSEARSGRGT